MMGTYILVIKKNSTSRIQVGALGCLFFEKGYYYYVGSAMARSGSTTLLNRVKRHLSPLNSKKTHWHIDYLVQNIDSSIIRVLIIPSAYRLECVLAEEISRVSDGFTPCFGSSDCQCKSHLFYFKFIKDVFL
jgi:Uri superfamily endonuclease